MCWCACVCVGVCVLAGDFVFSYYYIPYSLKALK